MSILNSIKEVEASVEKAKEEAAKKASDLFDEVRVETDSIVAGMFSKAEDKKKELDENYKVLVALKEKEILERYEKLDQEIKEDANKNINKAVKFILEKVMMS